jgi:hypothetical protein
MSKEAIEWDAGEIGGGRGIGWNGGHGGNVK